MKQKLNIRKTEIIFDFWASIQEQELRMWKMFSGTNILKFKKIHISTSLEVSIIFCCLSSFKEY
jgi:hypothetical protein